VPSSAIAPAAAAIAAKADKQHEYVSREGNLFYYQDPEGQLVGVLDLGELPRDQDFNRMLRKGDRAVQFEGRVFAAVSPGSEVVRVMEMRPGEQIFRPLTNVALSSDTVAAQALRDSIAGRMLYPSAQALKQQAVSAEQAVTAQPSQAVASPSFDCAKAATNVERMICADPSLGDKDRKVSVTYQTWIQRVKSGDMIDPIDEIVADQKAWVQRRNACETAACVSKAYDERIEELPTL
jgi:uncharacterized protein YecT (DUF1311 family)